MKDFEIYVSADGKNWNQPVAKGTLADRNENQTINLPQVCTGRFLKFVALSEVHGKDCAAVAELDVLEAADTAKDHSATEPKSLVNRGK